MIRSSEVKPIILFNSVCAAGGFAMATFHITAATSVATTGNGAHAFQSNIGPADKLVVDEGAFLIATGANAAGALLATSDWTVIINGTVFSQQYVGLRTNAPINLTV